MRTKCVLFAVGILFVTGCAAKEIGYTAKSRREMEATVKLSALGDKHFCKVFACGHRKKTLREIPDIMQQVWQAAIDREIKARAMEKKK